MKTITIRIRYTVYGNKSMRAGSFPLKGRKPEQVAYDWIRHIERKDYPIEEILKVEVDGEDITNLVKQIADRPITDMDDVRGKNI